MKEIFNVFLHGKTREKKLKIIERPKIIVDYREKNSLIISELTELGIDTEVRELKVADYIVRGTAIERKTVQDFISSMISRRLLSQLENMQQYESRLLIIEGIDEQELYTDSEERIGMHPNSVRGFLLSILLKHKTPIIFTKNYADTARFLAVLSKKKGSETPLNPGRRTLNKKEQMQFILEGFPGIGPKTARKLLKKFGTLKNILQASEEDLKEILGKKAEIFLKIINDQY